MSDMKDAIEKAQGNAPEDNNVADQQQKLIEELADVNLKNTELMAKIAELADDADTLKADIVAHEKCLNDAQDAFNEESARADKAEEDARLATEAFDKESKKLKQQFGISLISAVAFGLFAFFLLTPVGEPTYDLKEGKVEVSSVTSKQLAEAALISDFIKTENIAGDIAYTNVYRLQLADGRYVVVPETHASFEALKKVVKKN